MANTLTIVGLGPGDPELRTIAAQRALDSAPNILLRTAVHPGLDDLLADSRVRTCDDLYEELPTFRELYEAVTDRVLTHLGEGDLVYAVPGNPVAGEMTVIKLRSAAVAAGHHVTACRQSTPSNCAIGSTKRPSILVCSILVRHGR